MYICWPIRNRTIEFINDESYLTSPGIMLIRQFRLWKEFPDDDEEKQKLFNTAFLINLNTKYFHFVIDSTLEYKRDFTELDPDNLIQFTKGNPVKFFGYSPIKKIDDLDLCLETEECNKIINLAKLNDISFSNIDGSGTGRYTMEFWIKIKNLNYFVKGINIIWDKHVSISILTDAEKNKLKVICFPQDYLFSPNGQSGIDILTLSSKALNKYIIELK